MTTPFFALESRTFPHPQAQIEASYGFRDNTKTRTEKSGSDTTAADSVFAAKAAAVANSLAIIRSERIVHHRSGQCMCFSFDARFDDPKEGTRQLAGAFHTSEGFFVGFNGKNFGIASRKHGKQEVRKLTLSAPATGSENATVTVNGVAVTVALTAGTEEQNAKEIADTAFAGWDVYQNEGTVIFVANDPEARDGTFSFSSANAAGTFSQVQPGQTPTWEWSLQSEWNQERLAFFDPTDLNRYHMRIDWPAGNVEVRVFDANASEFRLVHLFHEEHHRDEGRKEPFHWKPYYSVGWMAESLTGEHSVTVRGSSGVAFLEGMKKRNLSSKAVDTEKTGIGSSTSVPVLSLRNSATFKQQVNLNIVRMQEFCVSTEGNKTLICDLLLNPTLTGPVNWKDVDSDRSCMEYDEGATGVSGGELKMKLQVFKDSSERRELDEFDLYLEPGEVLALTARRVSGSGSDASVCVNWTED